MGRSGNTHRLQKPHKVTRAVRRRGRLEHSPVRHCTPKNRWSLSRHLGALQHGGDAKARGSIVCQLQPARAAISAGVHPAHQGGTVEGKTQDALQWTQHCHLLSHRFPPLHILARVH